MNTYTGRRIERTNDFEEWRFYKLEYQYIDAVLIFFSNKLNEIYLITTRKNVEEEEEYISIISNLVHDLEVDFDFKIEYVDITGITDDEKVTDMVYDQASMLKSKKNKKI